MPQIRTVRDDDGWEMCFDGKHLACNRWLAHMLGIQAFVWHVISDLTSDQRQRASVWIRENLPTCPLPSAERSFDFERGIYQIGGSL